MAKRWNNTDQSVLKAARAKGVSYKSIAAVLGRTERAVYNEARILGLCNRRISDTELEIAITPPDEPMDASIIARVEDIHRNKRWVKVRMLGREI